MKLRSITIEGLRGIERETVELGPLTAFWGPNGSGKTAVVGSVIFALTGRFPGLVVPGQQSDSIGVLRRLGTDAAKGFQVRLETDKGWVGRVVADGKTHMTVGYGSERSKGEESADQLLTRMVGDVSWAVDMFDPDRSVWRMSPEKRSAWALGLCASASCWTQEQLSVAVGPATYDWDPTLHRDAGTCLELNIERVDSRTRAAQKVAREAAVITDGVSSEAETAVRERIATAEVELATVRDEVERVSRLLSTAQTEQAAIERNRRDRAALEPQIKELRAKVKDLLPPAEPLYPNEAATTVERIDLDVVALQLEHDAETENYRVLSEQSANAVAEAQLARSYRKVADETGCCPFCGSDKTYKVQDGFGRKIGDLEEKARVLSQRCEKSTTRQRELQEQIRGQEETRKQVALLLAIHQEEKATYNERCRRFEEGLQTLTHGVQALETQLGNVPPDRPDIDPSALTVQLAAQQARLSELTTTVNGDRQKLGVAAHRQGQLSAQTRATERVEQLKTLLQRLKEVRGRLLDDAVAPLRGALESLDVICVNGWKWTLRREATGIDMMMCRGYRSLPVESLSVGERYLATIALLVAKATVRREPWSGLFLDNFEAIFPESGRLVVLSGLVSVMQMDHSPVDNVLVAGACDASPAIGGVLAYVRGEQ